MQKLPISVFIITKNEEDRISASVKSVIDLVDEVIVIDSGSQDNTVKIANELGAKTVFNEWKGYVAQKQYGESLCRNKWILNIDADEEISPKLKTEIMQLFKKGDPEIKAFRLIITIMHRFDKKPKLFAPSNSPIRLYHTDFAAFNNDSRGFCHDSVLLKIETPVAKLRNIVFHRSMRSVYHNTEKLNSYSTAQAKELFEKGRKPNCIRLVLEFPLSFLKFYFLRRYFVFGLNGFIESGLFAFSKFSRQAKLYELWQEKRKSL